jgi:hypothetical protein
MTCDAYKRACAAIMSDCENVGDAAAGCCCASCMTCAATAAMPGGPGLESGNASIGCGTDDGGGGGGGGGRSSGHGHCW